MQEGKQPDPLIEARQLFRKEQYQQSKAKLESLKHSNENIDLNLLLNEYKINPGNSDIVLKALMDRLTEINIKLYKDMRSLTKHEKSDKYPIKYISHEFYYWNIIVMAQQIGKPSIASLMGKEALEFSYCFRSKTALMIIYEMLKQMACENRLASCGTLVMKFNQIFEKANKFTKEAEIYRAMNHIMWTRIFLRLGFLDESVQMYNQKLGKKQQLLFQSFPKVLPFEVYRQFLHAETEYFKENYQCALQVLGDILLITEKNASIEKSIKQRLSNMVENNVAAIFISMGKASLGRKMLTKTNDYFRKLCHQGIDNERYFSFERSKQLLFYSFLKQNESQLTNQDYSRAFELISKSQSNKSYKLFYRKGQLCVQYIHYLIRKNQTSLPYKQINDEFECTYYYINEPYFQSKGKNKNPYFNQGKRYYRRYTVENWEHHLDQDKRNDDSSADLENGSTSLMANNLFQQDNAIEVKIANKSQEINEDRPEKKKRKASNVLVQENKEKKNLKDFLDEQPETKKRTKSESKQTDMKINQTAKKDQQIAELAFQGITYFKQSLFLLEQEKKVILTFNVENNDLTERVNLKIYEDYRVFKQSILMNLCYMYLFRQNWTKVIQHSEMYRKFVAYDKESTTFETQNIKKAYNHQEHFCVLNYELEAYCQINKFSKAYETLQQIIQLGYSESVTFDACSSINLNPKHCFIEETNQYHNLLYTITILHMRDNHLPEAHQALQKILTETNILPNRSSFKTPLSVNDLLLHYHLRTGDRTSALEILKRRRVMGMGGVNGVYNVLKVTK